MTARNHIENEFAALDASLDRTKDLTDRLRRSLEAIPSGLIEGTNIPSQSILEELSRLARATFELQIYAGKLRVEQSGQDYGINRALKDSKEIMDLYQDGTKAWEELGSQIKSIATRRLLSLEGVNVEQTHQRMIDDWGDLEDAADAYIEIESNPQLHRGDKELLQLRYNLGLSQYTIAELMGVTQAATANRLNRALNRLSVSVGESKLRKMAENQDYIFTSVASNDMRRSNLGFSSAFQVQLDQQYSVSMELFVTSTGKDEPPKTDDPWYKRALIWRDRSFDSANDFPVLAIYRRKTSQIFLCLAYRFPEGRLGSLDSILFDIPTDFRSLHSYISVAVESDA